MNPRTIMSNDKLRDLCDNLEIPYSGRIEEIRSAYRRKSLQCHPDKHQHEGVSVADAYANRFVSLTFAKTALLFNAEAARVGNDRYDFSLDNPPPSSFYDIPYDSFAEYIKSELWKRHDASKQRSHQFAANVKFLSGSRSSAAKKKRKAVRRSKLPDKPRTGQRTLDSFLSTS